VKHASTLSGISTRLRHAMPNDFSELAAALQSTLGMRWIFDGDGSHLCIRHQAWGTPYRPPRRSIGWEEMLAVLSSTFTEHGIPRVPTLPLRLDRETDFTISAVQALDPYLKQCRPYTYRQGYLPQPVIRFNGQRDESGRLADGFLTAFVNVSCVLPIRNIFEHAQILDIWLTALSRLGLNARHVVIHGSAHPWQRREIRGITLRITHEELEIGDIVLLWNASNPSYMATDLGSGLERLRWAITRRPWPSVVHGSLGERGDPFVLDIVRAATLISGSGIMPSNSGPGNALRRLVKSIPVSSTAFGLSAAVRSAYAYWLLTSPLQLPWPEVCQVLETQVRIVD
jgi:hypothetical protein